VIPGTTRTLLRDLVPEGAAAAAEADPEVARVKSSAEMVTAIEPAVRLYEEPPSEGLLVQTDEADVWVSPGDWAEAFDAPEPGTPHNEALDQVWDALLSDLVDEHEEGDDREASPDRLRRALRHNEELVTTLNRAWTLIEPTDLVGDLWSVPAYLRRCAPWLTADEVRKLQRDDAQAWTVADLPLLDAARQRLGDPEASRRHQRRAAIVAADRAYMDRVVEDLLAADDDGEGLAQALRQQDLRDALVDEAALPSADPDRLAGPFAHIVVDEAQELTDAEWQMLLRRCPSRSFTIVGDRSQARHGFTESWQERLERVGFDPIEIASLSINYRTPAEIMAEAEPVIRAVFPDANVPTSVRTTGVPVGHRKMSELGAILDAWLETNPEGIACVIGTRDGRTVTPSSRVRTLTPEDVKGLEFDLVVLIDPDTFGSDGRERGIEGTVDRYVSMTRATQQLVLLTNG